MVQGVVVFRKLCKNGIKAEKKRFLLKGDCIAINHNKTGILLHVCRNPVLKRRKYRE